MYRGDSENNKGRGGYKIPQNNKKEETGEQAKGTVSQNSHDLPCWKAVIKNNRIYCLITIVKM